MTSREDLERRKEHEGYIRQLRKLVLKAEKDWGEASRMDRKYWRDTTLVLDNL